MVKSTPVALEFDESYNRPFVCEQLDVEQEVEATHYRRRLV